MSDPYQFQRQPNEKRVNYSTNPESSIKQKQIKLQMEKGITNSTRTATRN